MGVWSSSTIACCCSPTRRTRPSTSTSTSRPFSRRLHVREERREVLHPRQPSALLGRQPGELGEGPRGVREGLDRVLPRLPGPRPGGDALVAGEVPEVHGG